MEKNKFKVGDLIVGNAKAGKYRWTTVDWEGVVIKVLSDSRIKVEDPRDRCNYDVDSECFNFVAATQPNKPGESSYEIY